MGLSVLLAAQGEIDGAWLCGRRSARRSAPTTHPYTTTGQIRHYVRGHLIDGVEYPFLGYREDVNTWIWSRVLDDYSMEHIAANIIGDNSERANAVNKNSLYYLDVARYPNCMCYVEREDTYDVLVIVNDKFELLEKLYPGERPTTASGTETAAGIASMTLTGSDDLPTMLSLFPQGHDGYIDNALSIVRLEKTVPDYIPRLFVSSDSVGKAISSGAKAFGAWAWITPNMQLSFRNPGSARPSDFDMINHVTLGDGAEDEIGYWDQQVESIKAKYSVGREMTIGVGKWNTKDGSIDLDKVVFSSDHIEKIAMQAYMLYHPHRLAVNAPLMRGIIYGLWEEFFLHRSWISLSTQIDGGSLTSYIKGITAPVTLSQVWGKVEIWITQLFFWDVQGLWYYLGMVDSTMPCPGPPYPWCGTVFVGDSLGYPPSVCAMLRALFDEILAVLNAEGYEGDFADWWEIHNLDYWDETYAIIEALQAAGWFG